LEEAFELVQNIANKVDKKAIFAKRLKRIPSIKTKLERFDKMKLKNVHDIGGCRIVLSSEKKLRQVLRDLKKSSEFKIRAGKVKINDYIETPKEDGYRSVHIKGQFLNENKNKKYIEIQLRTLTQHYWATALEIIDLFTNQSLKTNQGTKEWKEFFTLVAEQFAIMERVHLFDSLSGEEQYDSYIKELDKTSKQKNQINYLRIVRLYQKYKRSWIL
jgi:ppGpp synthetase/RelA/SpoT-type nucleotidyltranferase